MLFVRERAKKKKKSGTRCALPRNVRKRSGLFPPGFSQSGQFHLSGFMARVEERKHSPQIQVFSVIIDREETQGPFISSDGYFGLTTKSYQIRIIRIIYFLIY